MSAIRIDEITESKTGKSWRIKSGNQWYGASKDDLTLQDKGRTFEGTVSTGDFGPWLTLTQPSKTPSPSPQKAPTSSQNQGAAPWWSNFMSNCVGQAISAGAIKEPTEIKAWALAAREAAEKAASGDINY